MNWKSVVGSVAPTLATVFGGPLAGLAASVAGRVLLGSDSATPEEVQQYVLANQSPETFSKLREIEAELTARLRELEVDLERVHASDRDSARQRQVQMRDQMPALIALAALCGFFGILTGLMFVEVPDAAVAPLQIMLGALATLVVSIGQYYFGSSAGSAEKSLMLERLHEGNGKGRPI